MNDEDRRPRIGTDTSKFPGAPDHDATWVIEQAHRVGLEGVFFRSVFEVSPTVDISQMSEVVAAATALGMYLEIGTAKVNPYATAEAPEIRALGGGDYVAGMTRLIEACATAGVHELWSATANYKFDIPGRLGCDRFRTDVSWADQLSGIASLMGKLAPVLRANGCHLNLETHEEITSFELVRLVEQAGPDAFGITFDTANVLIRAEDPVASARRVAPYTRQTHVRDAALFFTPDGIVRMLQPCGNGVIRWRPLLAELLSAAPRLCLSIEGIMDTRFQLPLSIYDPLWQAGHPDLTIGEFAEIVRLTTDYEHRAAEGRERSRLDLSRPADPAERLEFITTSAAYLRSTLAELIAADRTVPAALTESSMT